MKSLLCWLLSALFPYRLPDAQWTITAAQMNATEKNQRNSIQ